MFKTRIAVCALLWLALAIIYFYVWGCPSVDDWRHYHQLAHRSSCAKATALSPQLLIKQRRAQTAKQVFYTQEGGRQQSRLSSDSSELVVLQQPDGTVEATEHFHRLVLATLEINREAARLGAFIAKRATYSYQTGRLAAEEVQTKYYPLPSLHWPSSLEGLPVLMEAWAQQLSVAFFEGTDWRATGFELLFYGDEE